MKAELAPGFDTGWYGLISDLDRRGMLDDVLVVCTSEHGRTPKNQRGPRGGRDHWSRAYSSLIAGAGIKRGEHRRGDRQASGGCGRPSRQPQGLARHDVPPARHRPSHHHSRPRRPPAAARRRRSDSGSVVVSSPNPNRILWIIMGGLLAWGIFLAIGTVVFPLLRNSGPIPGFDYGKMALQPPCSSSAAQFCSSPSGD